ncbi:Hypothetical protein NGAL_HAMBI490_05940 [Neorhizobium galegae bv. officinalis]|jgi:uncharacterized C2H2 Zn-finger protein|nr:Hypothetical protein NGAL_HAMBI490_05940 [Neorhizobium galegae bv. officinalis]
MSLSRSEQIFARCPPQGFVALRRTDLIRHSTVNEATTEVV